MSTMRLFATMTAASLLAVAAGCTYVLDFSAQEPGGGGGGRGGSGGGSGGGGGAPALCTPGTTQPCYSGPGGTEGVGICQAGAQTCAADGHSWSACAGEVLPQVEDCAAPEDEDCDGAAPACTGTAMWAKRFGDGDDQFGDSVAADSAGNVVVTGYMHGTAAFDGAPISSAGGADVLLAKFDPAGHELWSRRFGDAADQFGASVAVDADGSIIVTGSFAGAVDFGSGPLVSAGARDLFVAKFDPAGHEAWSRRFGDAADQSAYGVAVDAEGSIVLTGSFSGLLDFGTGPLSAVSAPSAFLAKLDASGNAVWAKSFTGLAYGVAVDASGSVLATGQFVGSTDFGAGPVVSAGGGDVFVAKFDAAGAPLWGKAFGDAGNQTAQAIAVDANGAAIVTGWFAGAIDFGGTQPLVSAGGYDVFVAKLDPSGNHVWSKRYGDSKDQYGMGVAADPSGNIALTGKFFGGVEFGGNQLTSKGGTDVFVAKLKASGEHLWSARYGDVADFRAARPSRPTARATCSSPAS